MANEKILNTRIQLKYDSYANWVQYNPTLLAGEIAIAKVVSDVTLPVDETKNAPVLFKVGPGKFNDLPWASALAADVHAWAKKSEDDFKAWVNTIVEHPAAPVIATGSANGTISVDGEDVAVQGLGDAAYTTVEALNATAKGYADAVLGTTEDEAGAQTVHGANKLAAAAKARIDAFIDGTAEAESAIDTLVEIQQYMTSDTQAFTTLSGKVTDIENGTTATTAGDLTAALEAEIKGYTVANAEKLGGQLPAYYATADSVTEITKDNGTIDTKIKAVTDTFGDIVTHNAAEFATNAENGAKALADANKLAIDAINHEETGILVKAKAYTDGEINKLHKVATSGSAYDLDEVNVVGEGDDAVKYFVFNCGSASTLVD